MSEIKFDKELYVALINCKDAKEIMALTKSKGVTLTEEEAGKVYAMLSGEELTDEETDIVVGGVSV